MYVAKMNRTWSWRKHIIATLLFLVGLLVPKCSSMIDQICLSLGRENLAESGALFFKDAKGLYTPNPNFCQTQWSYNKTGISGSLPDPTAWRRSSVSIGAHTYQLPAHTPKALSFLAPKHGSYDRHFNQCVTLEDHMSNIQLDVFSVRQGGRPLKGWLSFELTVREAEIGWMFLQISDENANAIGEFVANDEEKCTDKSSQNVRFPRRTQFLPCSTAGLQEAEVSRGMIYINPKWRPSINSKADDLNRQSRRIDDIQAHAADDPNTNTTLKYRMTWRLNEYFCSRHQKFRIVLYVLWRHDVEIDTLIPGVCQLCFKHDHGQTLFKRYFWMYPQWYGVADVLERNSDTKLANLLCDEKVYDNEGNVVSHPPDFWIEKVERSTPGNDNLDVEKEKPGMREETMYKSCRTLVTRLEEFVNDVARQPSFGGRCETIDEKKFKPGFYGKHPDPKKQKPSSTSNVDVPHNCKKNSKASYPDNMEDYGDYMKEMNRMRDDLCSKQKTTCPKNFTKRDVFFTGYTNLSSKIIWRSRAYHGVLSTFANMLFLPISNFFARYFKETFMEHDVFGMKSWFFVHICGTLLALCMYMSSMAAILKSRKPYGRSWSNASHFHRGIGWFSLSLFCLVAILGPIRHKKHFYRNLIMYFHAGLGFLQHATGLMLLISSTVIPGSPSASTCYHDIENFGNRSAFSQTSEHRFAAVAWVYLSFDIVFHIIMNVLQVKADQAWKVERHMYFPLVPIIRSRDRRSFKYFRYRAIVLIFYIAFLIFIDIAFFAILTSGSWTSCDLGPMTCTHENNSPDSDYSENKCGKISQIREMRRQMKV